MHRNHFQLAALVVAALAHGGLPTRSSAQIAPAVISMPEVSGSVAVRADALFHAGDVEGSLVLLRRHLVRSPGDYPTQWMAARSAVALGMIATEEDEQNSRYREAIGYGEVAVGMEPHGLSGLYWLVAAKGRLALQQGPRATARLAQEVYDGAHLILALDSLHAGAYDVLGKLNYEVMNLSGWKRALARAILGNEALRDSSWEKGEAYLLRAVELAPEVVLYHLDLGRLYWRTDRPAEARARLEQALALPSSHPADDTFKDEARALLDRLPGAR
ncbi:MAG: hypothetical protein OEZ65_08530 [Gemmatimonadota bacterium]|nr:hypothetical protein [Gemmatimonadota bacterium]MDH5759623.1 hypothetical protein [Gemmatimonadota bacterium]